MEAPEPFILQLDYQKLDIEENFTTVGWTIMNGDDCDTFIVKKFVLSIQNERLTEQDFNITIFNRFTATIPSDEYVNSAGDIILFRIIAETICSPPMMTETPYYYRFDGMQGYY